MDYSRNLAALVASLTLAGACGGSPATDGPSSPEGTGFGGSASEGGASGTEASPTTSGETGTADDSTSGSAGAAAGTSGTMAGATAGAAEGTASGGAEQGAGDAAAGEAPALSSSPGCGAAVALESGTFKLEVDGLSREYVLDVPTDYDPSHPYPLVFVWHPLGGSARGVVLGGYNGLRALADGGAIFVAPDGLQTTTSSGIPGQGWRNEEGRDMAFLKAMLAHFNDNLCIDQTRVFSTGFSFGGMMSYAIGCELADVFRAIAPASGNSRGSGCNQTTDHPIAVLGMHGDRDDFVETEGGRTARDLFVARNHCEAQTEPTDPAPCVAYQGCDEGYPVIWCEFSGAHQPWSEAPEIVWSFFSQF